MRLSEFIQRDMEAILGEWQSFAAAQLPAAAEMNSSTLRDHAAQILRTVVEDINTPQDEEERDQKAKGRAARRINPRVTQAEIHARLRAQGGFNISQMAGEYRALRASVLRLWARACEPAPIDVQDMIRFNEAIDQAVAESVAFFSNQVDSERNLLLAMLGHDMRSPLQVILFTARALSRLDVGPEVATHAARLFKSSNSLKLLLDDLLDFNRTKLGLGITISPAAVNLAEAFAGELEQLRAANPGRSIELQVHGDVTGTWDINRLHQLLGNLVVNALKYGAHGSPVKIALRGSPDEVVFAVHNRGSKIDPSLLPQIFLPLKRGSQNQFVSGTDNSFGLGLYIAREVALAHGGDISVVSDDRETVFTVRLPRLNAGR